MKTRAMIRHPLLAASLGAAVVALPASALYLYGSGHAAKAAGTLRRRGQRARAQRSAGRDGLPDFRPAGAGLRTGRRERQRPLRS